MYNASLIRSGDLTVAYENVGGNLVWLPCTPCNIGVENVLLPDTVPDRSQLLLRDEEGQFASNNQYLAFNSSEILDNTAWAVAHVDDHGYVGFLLNSEYECATVTPPATVSWEPCDPTLMLGHTSAYCQGAPELFTVGIFQYVCTQGHGGSIQKVELVPEGCTDLGTGNLDGGQGYGATIGNTGEVFYGGIGYTSGERILPTGATTCQVRVSTNKVLIQPESGVDNFDIGTANIEVINTTAFTGFFSSAYEQQVYAQRLHFSGVLTTLNVVVLTVDLAIVILIVALIFYEDELTQEIENQIE